MLIIYNRITSFLYTFFTLSLFHNIYAQSHGHVHLTSNITISQKTNLSTPTISSSTPSSTQTQMPFIYEPLPPSETIIVIVVISIITLIIGVVAIGITLSMFRQHKLKNSNVFETTTIDIEQQQQPREVNNFVESGFLEEPSTLELEQENIILPNHDLIMLQHKLQPKNNYKLPERGYFDINIDEIGENSNAVYLKK
ncbi:13999_t:CDS:1 [Gigaspora margarita]|uniref:13999_t:CDS:1 n=1 Tax=Gigaspora margarita TaxID=4874 RepID=A0ABN7VN47_GIGMA|nr:13999_t:CDS:1 [Gigaspora margarita]